MRTGSRLKGLWACLTGTVWAVGGCTSFYLDDGGRNTTLWPHRAALFRRAVRRFDATEYELTGT